jgi:hypothetical protein
MSEFPLDPQLAKMLVASPEFRCWSLPLRVARRLGDSGGLAQSMQGCHLAIQRGHRLLCSRTLMCATITCIIMGTGTRHEMTWCPCGWLGWIDAPVVLTLPQRCLAAC